MRPAAWIPVPLLAALLVLGTVPSQAQICPGPATVFTPVDWEVLTVSGTARTLTIAKIPPSSLGLGMVRITVKGGAINYSDVITPTSTLGDPVSPGTTFYLCSRASLLGFKAIRQASDATIEVTYYQPN